MRNEWMGTYDLRLCCAHCTRDGEFTGFQSLTAALREARGEGWRFRGVGPRSTTGVFILCPPCWAKRRDSMQSKATRQAQEDYDAHNK